jgi:hypothetical protein
MIITKKVKKIKRKLNINQRSAVFSETHSCLMLGEWRKKGEDVGG